MTGSLLEKPDLDPALVNEQLADSDAAGIVRWAADAFGAGLMMSSSFGAQSAVMLHLVTKVVPDIPVILIDTGYLFPETYQFVEQLTASLKLNLKVYQPRLSPARHEALHGRQWEQDEDGLTEYNQVRKVEPMRRAMRELQATAWLAGLRREQTDYRATLETVQVQDGVYKVHPVLNWTTQQVHRYLTEHDLPYHPLYQQGYSSIGDHHSTVPITAGMSERDGRFAGLKQECGLHLPTSTEEEYSRESSGL